MLSGRVTSGAEGTAARLASIAQHAQLMRVNIVLMLLQAAYAVVLAVTLYAITRDQDRDLAMLALCARVGEGLINAVAPLGRLPFCRSRRRVPRRPARTPRQSPRSVPCC